MGKRRMVLHGLIKNSVAAYFAAIEIHNKPNIAFRYETVSLLLVNAWELALKAYVRKYTRHSIFGNDSKTIKLNKALNYVEVDINKLSPGSFAGIRGNILLLEEFRNTCVHFYSEEIDPIIFSLVAKSTAYYTDFMREYFGKDVFQEQNLVILPLGFKLPFKPEVFLSSKSATDSSSPEVSDFIKRIVQVTTELKAKGIDDSVVMGFDVHLTSSKDITNADLLAKIETSENALPLSKKRQVRISNDSGAQPIMLTDEEFFNEWPLEHSELVDECKKSISGFKQDGKFIQIKKQLKAETKFANSKSVNKDGSGGRWYYSRRAVAEVARLLKMTCQAGE